MKSRHSKCSFALSTYSEVRNKPLTIKTYSHKPVQTYSNKPRTFLLCEKQWCNSGVGKYRVAAQCWSVKKLLPAVRNQSQIGQKVTGTTDIRRHCGCHWPVIAWIESMTRLWLESQFLVTLTPIESRWERRWLDSTRVTFFTEWPDSTRVTISDSRLESE